MEILIAADKRDGKELFDLYTEWVNENVSPKTIKMSLKEFMAYLGKSTTFIARENGKIMGFLVCRMKKSYEDTIMYNLKKGEEYANIDSIYIKAGHRKKGIGSSLIRACRKELKKHGNPKIIVLADSTNPRELMSFYEKNGFKTLFVSMENQEGL
jgi:ribosomal protein S18 acetylase RimI-like enzyme